VFQEIGESLHGGELAIGIKNIELGVVRRVGRTGIFADVVFAALGGSGGKSGELRIDSRSEAGDSFLQIGALVREILKDAQLISEHGDGHEIGGRHLFTDEFEGSIAGAQKLVVLHRR